MRTKYLLAIAAMSGLFAACSQEELLDSTAVKTNPLAGRAIVGNVEFVSEEAETRYDSENCKPTDGDAIGLYLMDEFRGWNNDNKKGELDNANHTLFEYQSNWWQMYQLTNNIQSNYGYEYVPENGTWINRASQLVEGNYMVMLPKNDVATNRRDLWKEIKPVVDLKHHSERTDKYYVNRDNQFMLDYKQIYRNQRKDENGKLTIGVKFRYILTYAKFAFENQGANQFIAQKLVFKAPKGKALPTVAYVKPVDVEANNLWNDCPSWIAQGLNKQKIDGTIAQQKDECGNVIAEGLYDKDWFTQKVARSMVQYATTEDLVPYGMENDNVAYEYTFNFPDEGEGGVRLEGNNTAHQASERVMAVSIALPAFDMGDYDWTDMEVVVYGKMFDPTANNLKGAYRYGVLRKLENKDNAEFTLDKLKLWESGMEIPTANLHFDDQYFYQEEEIRVESTEDLLNLIDARLSDATTTKDVNFEVYPYGKGLEITDAVVEKIDEYKDKHGVNVNITFKSDLTQEKTPVILKTDNCINKFQYNSVNVVIVGSTQTVEKPVVGIKDLTIGVGETTGRLIVNENLTASSITVTDSKAWNEDHTSKFVNYMEINNATVTTTKSIHNMGWIQLNEDAEVEGGIINDDYLDVAYASIVDIIVSDNECVDCGKYSATVKVEQNAVLVIAELINGENGVLTNQGTINAIQLQNDGQLDNDNDAVINAQLKNNGNLENLGLMTFSNYSARSINTKEGTIDNKGEIRVNRSAEQANHRTPWDNEGTIYNHGIIMDVNNNGLIYQDKADEAKLYIANGVGKINVTGCTAGLKLTEIEVQGQDKQTYIYDVTKSMKDNELAGTSVLNIINVHNATLTIEKSNVLPEWTELNMENATLDTKERYTWPNNVNVNVIGGENNKFKGIGANFTQGILTVSGLDTHSEIQKDCKMMFLKAVVDGDLKCFGTLELTEGMTGMGYYNGNKIK